ncbi:hypothetical protein ACHAPJ_002857 [Fusarium lateritium]
MSLPSKEGKHLLSPSPQPSQTNTKKSRATYVVESPGGTMREADPPERHQPVAFSEAPEPEVSKPAASGSETFGIPPGPSLASSSLRPASLPVSSIPQSANSQQTQKEQLPDQRHRRRNTNQDLSQEHLSTLSVREKLRKGIAMGFANNMAHVNYTHGVFQNDPHCDTRPQSMNSMTIAGMMKRTNTFKHMDTDLSSHLFSNPPEGENMVNHELTNKKPGASEPSHLRKKKIQHFQAREPHLVSASERLQAVTESANFHRFNPTPLPKLHPSAIMLVEPFVYSDTSLQSSFPPNPPSLISWLEWASRRFGCKKLELGSITFKHNSKANNLEQRSTQGSESILESTAAEDAFEIDTLKGSITLYEANVACGSPQEWQNWTWFKITKPLFDIEGPVPEELKQMPQTTLVFAIPTAKIEKIKEDQEQPKPDWPAKLGDFGRLKLDTYTHAARRQLILEWKFSKNGIPSFSVTPRPWYMRERGFPPDFLWVECAPCYSGQEYWWRTVLNQAMNERAQWENIQQLMAGNVCRVEAKSKHGDGWVHVKPATQVYNAGLGLGPDSGPGGRRVKTTRVASGLRNEVQHE